MSIILEMICSGCASGCCTNHQNKTNRVDTITGLEFEIRCVCNNHNLGDVKQ